MSMLEDRVRAALAAHAEEFSAQPDAWARIQDRSRAALRRRRGPRWSRLNGITVFRYPAGLETQAGAVTAYLIDGRVGFWSLTWGGYIAPGPAAGGPAANGLILPFGLSQTRQHPSAPPKLLEAFGYARGDVTRVVLHLPGGRQAAGSTVAAWPGSGVRLWAISLSTHLDYMGRSFTVTAYDAAGHVVATDTLGTIG